MALCSRSLAHPNAGSLPSCRILQHQDQFLSFQNSPALVSTTSHRWQIHSVRSLLHSSGLKNAQKESPLLRLKWPHSFQSFQALDRLGARSESRWRERFACRAADEERDRQVQSKVDEGPPYGVLSMLALWLFWAGLAYYAVAVAPNQTPTRDEYFLGKLTLLIRDDYPINQVLLSEFNIMGIWPAVYTALLIPSGRSHNLRPPVWPFASLSLGIGIGGLLPYFALWQQPTPPPPSKEERETLLFKVLESKITAGVLLAGTVGLIGTAIASGPDSWIGFYQYFQESKFVNVMTLDFLCLTLFCPFWLYNDMEFRNWSGRNTWILPLSLLPVLGPVLYLLIRPPLPEPSSDKQVAEAPKPIG